MLYTGKGDTGYTRVIGGKTLPKDDLRLEILGALDEAQAHLGFARASLTGTSWAPVIERIQTDMRMLMAEIAIVPKEGCDNMFINQDHIKALEKDLDEWNEIVGKQNTFSNPGNSMLDAHLHLARTIVRRAERGAVALQHLDGISNPTIIVYLNRLSSWIYALILMTQGSDKNNINKADTA